ncbi:MAG TPA: response regulator transcription factor [Draconibacterium sp.]|nr:response regulator transcription factor [Draconibacterium sp.]
MTNGKFDIIVTDDHRLFRKGMCALLSEFDDVGLTGEAGHGEELIQQIKLGEISPDLVLLDINMPVMDGVETTRYLKAHYPGIRIIILSMEEDVQLVTHLIGEGVDGYLLKNSDPDELEHAIRMVMRNEFYLSTSLTGAIFRGGTATDKVGVPEFDFTERELEILQLICEQFTATEIAEKLLISARTAEGHRRKLLEKSKSKNMAGLVVFAIKNKLVVI